MKHTIWTCQYKVVFWGMIMILAGCFTPSDTPQIMGVSADSPDAIPAFPGAEGFGAYSRGGRGGRVIAVVNLNDSGAGSLREAIMAQGPRTIVFRVSGIIDLQSKIEITEPYITIAGQTAPGGGITIRGGKLNILTHDVVIRYLRIRLGRTQGRTQDSVNLAQAHNVIIDHSSFSWGTDEVASVAAETHHVTLQWSIISEGLRTQTADLHSTGTLVSSGAYNISIHHNLYAHNSERNPKLDGDPTRLAGQTALYDFVNNVVYNWGDYATAVSGNAHSNIIGNRYILGPDSFGYRDKGRREVMIWQELPDLSLYIANNVGPSCPQGCFDNWQMTSLISGDSVGRGHQTMTPHPAAPVTTTTAAVAYAQVLAHAGASLPLRDAVDSRLVDEVGNSGGQIIADPTEVGGWPHLALGAAPKDSDHDGMPDSWEQKNGLDPQDSSDGAADMNGDGYTNLEDYLNDGALQPTQLLFFPISPAGHGLALGHGS